MNKRILAVILSLTIALSFTIMGITVVSASSEAKTFKAVYTTIDNSLTFYYDDKDYTSAETTCYIIPDDAGISSDWPYGKDRLKFKKVVIDESVQNYKGLRSMKNMFMDMYYADSITGAEYLDTSAVADMSYLFDGFAQKSHTINCVPDVSNWDTSNVTTMERMFTLYGAGSEYLNEVPDVSGADGKSWNTENVTSLENAFYKYAQSSTVLDKVPDVSRWKTGKVGYFYSIFNNYGTSSKVLRDVPDVSNWDMSSALDIIKMFYNYGSESVNLQFKLNLSKWDLSKVKNCRGLFDYCAHAKDKWEVIIPAATGTMKNTVDRWYCRDANTYVTCPDCGGEMCCFTISDDKEQTLYSSDVELLNAKTSGNNAVKLSWNKIDGATEYVVYGQQCGKKYKKLTTTTKSSYTVKKISGKKLKSHKAYKFYVKAITANGEVKSKSIHFITGNTNGKYANAKSISVNKDLVSLDVGETAKLKVTTKIYKNKKHLSNKHGAATRYISDNPNVATVNSKGVVTAKGIGAANIYIQDISGKYCKTTVMVQATA